jgi:hypothetical protein
MTTEEPTTEATKLPVPKHISRYMRELAYRSAASIKGTEAAKLRAQKARAARTQKAAERKAAGQ